MTGMAIGLLAAASIVSAPIAGRPATAANTPPTITRIDHQQVLVGETATAFFTVSDAETDPASLVVAVSIDGETLLPPSSYSVTAGAFAGGYNRRLDMTPVLPQGGIASITVTVTDDGIPPLQAATTFMLLADGDDPPFLYTINDQWMDENTTLSNVSIEFSDAAATGPRVCRPRTPR